MMDRHWGVVKDYDRDDGGTVRTNGVLRVLCPSLGGDKVFRVGPLLHGLYRIPAVGETVAVARSHGNRYCWTAERQASDLPAWMTTDYPNRSGLSNADGSVLVVLDKLWALLGGVEAVDTLARWPGLATWLAEFRTAYLAHTHGGTVAAPSLPVELVSAVPDCATTKVKAV